MIDNKPSLLMAIFYCGVGWGQTITKTGNSNRAGKRIMEKETVDQGDAGRGLAASIPLPTAASIPKASAKAGGQHLLDR